MEEGLVPDNLKAILSTFLPKLPKCQLLYTLNDTFIIDFSICTKSFTIITKQGVEALFYDGQFKGSPYTGAYTNHLD